MGFMAVHLHFQRQLARATNGGVTSVITAIHGEEQRSGSRNEDLLAEPARLALLFILQIPKVR